MKNWLGYFCLILMSASLQNALAQGNGVAVGNCIVGQTAPGTLRAKTQIIGAKYFYIDPSDRTPNCRKSLKTACLALVTDWVRAGIVSSKVLEELPTHYWYVDFQRYSCKDIDDRIPDPEGVPLPETDLDDYFPDWRSVVKAVPSKDPALDPGIVRDLRDLVRHIYENAPWTTILAVGAILVVLLGIKGIEGALAGPLAAEPASVAAALMAIVLIAMDAGVLEGPMRDRFEKYSANVTVEKFSEGTYVFENHPDIDVLRVDEADGTWELKSKDACEPRTSEGGRRSLSSSGRC